MDAIIRIYAPCKAEELVRVVKPGGWVITATPGPRHLIELKGLIYNEVHLHAPHAEQLKGFTLQQSDELCYLMRLRGDEAVALLQMTPFAWRAKPEVWQALAAKKCSTARRTLIFTSGSVLINQEVRPEDLDANTDQYQPAENFRFFPIIEPIKRPTIIPNVDIIKVAQPMVMRSR